jgi:hypothetical protein
MVLNAAPQLLAFLAAVRDVVAAAHTFWADALGMACRAVR